MASQERWWWLSRHWIAPLVRVLARPRGYGLDRWPLEGGCVLAFNHIAWMDIGITGTLSPRDINYIAKVELRGVPLVGAYLQAHGIVAIRRGESDRDAVRKMRELVREGRSIGVFVEGTRQKSGRPGKAQPGAAMVAISENVPVVPIGIYGTQFWTLTNRAPCSLAVGEPFLLDGYGKGGQAYKAASEELERRINVLYDWLAEVHAQGRPKGLTPPL